MLVTGPLDQNIVEGKGVKPEVRTILVLVHKHDLPHDSKIRDHDDVSKSDLHAEDPSIAFSVAGKDP